MKGAIAAGHPKTVEAGTRMYALGGNAFDATLAALAAACVVEPVLTSLGGGGFLLSRRPGEHPVLHDFFVQTPRHKRSRADCEFFPITADFGTVQQEFHIGAASIATPGTARGLVGCHQALGSLPLREIVAPAIEYAHDGVAVNELQAYFFGILTRSARHRALLASYLESMARHPVKRRGTTHISAIDAAGNSAALTLSNGEGCGHLLPDTGVMLNNMLGEEDLNPHGFGQWDCNVRVSSMMAPTLAEDLGHLIAIGSGGSNRLRTAILQTLCNLIDFRMPPEQAVAAPRLHVERGRLDIEPGYPAETLEQLVAVYPDHCVWSAHNMFFGGTHTVCWDGHRFTGAGDPRRGGHFATH